MTTYRDLVAAATIGVAQRPLSVSELPGPASGHSTVLDADPATRLLDAAALLDAAQRAGRLFATSMSLPSPAPADSRPELPVRAGLIVTELLQAGPADVLADLLSAAAHAGFRAPAPFLPTLLSAAAANSALRGAVAATLGERGRWLAAHQPEWLRVVDSGVVPVADDAWETGRFAERRSWLAQLRRRDPDAARELLAEGWVRETGDDRAELITVLVDGLSVADEPFLEAALDDRRADVRQHAAQLLQLLPGSAYQARARARAAHVLHLERRRIVVTLPDELDDTARRDGLDARPRTPRTGVKTWLLTQMIAAAPLELWTAIFGGDPRSIVARPIADDFAPDVHAGWRRAAVRQHNAEWARALLDANAPSPSDRELAALLPHAERRKRAVALLQRSAEATRLVAEVQSCPPPWDAELGEAVLGYLGRELASDRPVRPGALLATVARAVPVDGATDYAAELRRLADDAPVSTGWPPALRRAAGIVELRRRFHEELR